MSTKATILADVQRVVKLDAGLTILSSGDLEDIIQTEAVQIYSKHRPYKRIKDLTANSTYSYEVNSTIFTGWEDEVSVITKVLYPADEYQNPEDEEIQFEDWEIYETASAKYLRFTAETPGSGTIRVFYTSLHSVPDSGDATIYPNDVGAFTYLAASLAALAVADFYGNTSNSNIAADAVAYRDKSDVWGTRSNNLLAKYIKHMFPDNVLAAGAFREFDTMYKELGYQRLTHKEWTR